MSAEFFTSRRYERLLKHISTLKLKFPNEMQMRQLAKLAQVKASSIETFSRNIRNIIVDAHLNDAEMKGQSTPEVKKTLSSVAKQAAQLSATLRKMDLKIAGGTGGSNQTAGTQLEWELATMQEQLFPNYSELLDSLHTAATRAAMLSTSKRGPKGAGGNRAFDLFVQHLWIAAFVRGGRLSTHRVADGTWKGTMLDALQLLEPYLPTAFSRASQGRSIDHILSKLKRRQREHT